MKLGSKENPYNYSDYESMVANHTWTGGWVRDTHNLLCYITSSGNVESNQNGDVLGSIDNPFSHEAYTEMYAAETWPGGYVLDSDNIARYYHRYYGSSGCGCETGCGCGCSNGGRLTEGSATFRPSGYGVGWSILVEWGSGVFSGQDKPSVKAALTISGSTAIGLKASWGNSYRVNISGTIKTNYGETHKISTEYVIPENYRH